MPEPTAALAPTLIMIVLEAGRSPGPVTAAFAKYRAAAGTFALDVRSDRAAVLSALQDDPGSDRHLVLWDASAGMPPKEIEILVHGLAPGSWRAGTRRAALSVSRGGTAWGRWSARIAGGLRRAAGNLSESRPPCLAVPAAFIRDRIDQLSAAAETEWTAILVRAARREGIRIVEAPVMSAS